MVIEVTEQATERIALIAEHLDGLRQTYRRNPALAEATAASFGQAMTRVFGLLAKGGRLVADHDTGSLSLGVSTSHGLYVGVVFFADSAYRDARVANDKAIVCSRHGAPWPNAEDHKRCPASTGEDDWCGLPLPAPMPGTWSLHS